MSKANSNFHHVAGEDLLDRQDARFKEYRRRWADWPETYHVGDFPLFIDMEVTSACNLRCPFCATTYRGGAVKKGFMEFDLAKKVMDEGAEKGLYGVKFNIRGEPLLHPGIYDFVEYAKRRGLIDVYFNTNAVLLDEDACRRLIDARLDRISISIEGYTKDIYEKYRIGSNFEKVLSNIITMQDLKKKLKVAHPKIRIQTVMLPEIVSIFDNYKKFWSERADEVACLDYKEMKRKKTGVRHRWACPQLWQRLAIWWDGTVLPCNHDDDGLMALGNAGDITIEQAWNAEKLNRVRNAHKEGEAHAVSACDGCYLRDSEIAKEKNR